MIGIIHEKLVDGNVERGVGGRRGWWGEPVGKERLGSYPASLLRELLGQAGAIDSLALQQVLIVGK